MVADQYTSYLVRLWLEQQAGGERESPAWQGEILHIQSGSQVSFQDMGQLSRYLLEHLEEDDDIIAVLEG